MNNPLRVTISKANLDDSCIDGIRSLLRVPHLVEFDVSHNRLGKQAGFALAEALRECPTLSVLSVHGNPFAEALVRPVWYKRDDVDPNVSKSTLRRRRLRSQVEEEAKVEAVELRGRRENMLRFAYTKAQLTHPNLMLINFIEPELPGSDELKYKEAKLSSEKGLKLAKDIDGVWRPVDQDKFALSDFF